ncbi:MAG: tRNA (adenosine(37)-N6)-threonylcarbamoyltransferase complex dimerization subunit type 1 TsaB [Proteobacteria bacterium]|nr:tRNA (adenosine(37)-N6)-threonylcarbamoyltransferase complex dimerization subunit type 1 TsaB [Pseudomonadota bacterium]
MSIVLAIDTAAAACSVAVLDQARVFAQCSHAMQRGQAEALLPMVEQVMAKAALDFSGLDLIAVTRGPGAFTGIRIGLAAARGLAFAAGKPCLGVETLSVLAEPLRTRDPARPLLAVMDTKRGDFYAEMFIAGPQGDAPAGPRAVDADGLVNLVTAAGPLGGRALLVIGDTAETAVRALGEAGIAAEAADPAHRTPDPCALGRVALSLWRRGETVPLPQPLYLRPPQVSEPNDRR